MERRKRRRGRGGRRKTAEPQSTQRLRRGNQRVEWRRRGGRRGRKTTEPQSTQRITFFT